LHDHPAIVVFTNVPDNATARALAQALLDERLAACVNIGAPVDSMYHVEAAIRNIHPYDTPEIIAIQVAAGDERYLRWIAAEARSG